MGNTDNQFELDNFNLNSGEWNTTSSHNPRGLGVAAMPENITLETMTPETITPENATNLAQSPETSATPNATPIANPNESIEFAPPENPLANSANALPQPNLAHEPDAILQSDNSTQSTPTSAETAGAALKNSEAYAKHEIKTADKLADAGVEAVDKAISKLGRDGDAANFYETARKMMEDNLENSYNRKLGV